VSAAKCSEGSYNKLLQDIDESQGAIDGLARWCIFGVSTTEQDADPLPTDGIILSNNVY
jgi:hypothetical protein